MSWFSTLLAELEGKAKERIGNKMCEFMGEGLCCPWLRYRMEMNSGDKRSKGLFLMQDWGNEKELLANAKLQVQKTISGDIQHDRTLDNLVGSGWSKHFKEGNWCVTNAVWGLRTGDTKCGYLGGDIHRNAFPIWLELIHRLKKTENFSLVVAGEWAVFQDEFKNNSSSMSLPEYLQKWVRWLEKKKACSKDNIEWFSKISESCSGTVYHVAHPATWRWMRPTGHDWSTGPLP